MDSEIGDVCVLRSTADSFFMASTAAVIMMMQTGFALLEVGSVRTLSTVNIMQKNMLDLAVGTFTWLATGYGLAFGKGTSTSSFAGTGEFFTFDIKDPAFWFFQYSFSATASTIDSAAAAERMKLRWYLALSSVTSGLIYPVVAHWVWDASGWLFQRGFIDFAGSGVVHLVGGTSSLVLGLYLGPRVGKMGKKMPRGSLIADEDVALCHKALTGSLMYQLFGCLMLWFCWYSFNAGSALTIGGHNGVMAGRICMTTTLAACGACASGMMLSMVMEGNVKPRYFTDGSLGGLVAITSFPHIVTNHEAIIVGILATFVAYFIAEKLAKKIKFDDPVGALPVHFGCGAFGVIAPGLFGSQVGCGTSGMDVGLFHGGGFHQLSVQLMGFVVILLWTAILTYITLRVFDLLAGGIRVDVFDEFFGMDYAEHCEDHLGRIAATKKISESMEGLIKRMGMLNAEHQALMESASLRNADADAANNLYSDLIE